MTGLSRSRARRRVGVAVVILMAVVFGMLWGAVGVAHAGPCEGSCRDPKLKSHDFHEGCDSCFWQFWRECYHKYSLKVYECAGGSTCRESYDYSAPCGVC